MRLFQIAFQNIRRSPYQALSAISVMSLTLFVAGIVFLGGIGSSIILKYFESKPQITAFFSDDKNKEEIGKLEVTLKNTGKVASIKQISKDEALEVYRNQNKNDPILLEMVTADILPASMEVSAIDAKDLSQLADILHNEKGVEDVVYQKDVVESLIAWTNSIRIIGLVLLVFLSLESLLIILTVIGIRVALKKEEIEILRLVGASTWYIRSPFLLEGVIYGIIGGLVSFVAGYLLLLYLTPFLSSLFTGLPLSLPPSIIFTLIYFSSLIAFGVFLGVLGSYLGVKRYLK